MGALPGDAANSTTVLGSLGTRLESINNHIQALQQDKSMQEALLATQTQSTPTVVAAKAEEADELLLEKAQANLADLQTHYTEEYPEVKAAHRQVADLQAKMARAAKEPSAPAAPAAPHPDSIAVVRLKTQIKSDDAQVALAAKEQADINAQMRSYQGRIASSPAVEQTYTELTRNYNTENGIYNGLLAQMNKSQMAGEMENRQQGENFTVLDSASLPIDPTYPKQSVFAMGGLGGGLALGVLIVALLEYRDTALRNERDVWAFTQLPTLAVIAWSGDNVAENQGAGTGRLKRLFSRKDSKELLAG
jgi:uncharacterized protein involved in exopolysaccharide biosynthesis